MDRICRLFLVTSTMSYLKIHLSHYHLQDRIWWGYKLFGKLCDNSKKILSHKWKNSIFNIKIIEFLCIHVPVLHFLWFWNSFSFQIEYQTVKMSFIFNRKNQVFHCWKCLLIFTLCKLSSTNTFQLPYLPWGS